MPSGSVGSQAKTCFCQVALQQLSPSAYSLAAHQLHLQKTAPCRVISPTLRYSSPLPTSAMVATIRQPSRTETRFLRDWRRDEPTKTSLETVDLLWSSRRSGFKKARSHCFRGMQPRAPTPCSSALAARSRASRSTCRAAPSTSISPMFQLKRSWVRPFSQDRRRRLLSALRPVRLCAHSTTAAFVTGPGSARRARRASPASIRAPSWPAMAAWQHPAGSCQYRWKFRTDDHPSPPAGQPLLRQARPEVVLAAVASTPAPTATAAVLRDTAPKPRAKPIEVLMLAAASMQITPASAPAFQQNFSTAANPSPVRGSLGPVTIASGDEDQSAIATNAAAKGSLNSNEPVSNGIRPFSVSYANTSSLADLFTNTEALARRNGAPQPFVRDDENAIYPGSAMKTNRLWPATGSKPSCPALNLLLPPKPLKAA